MYTKRPTILMVIGFILFAGIPSGSGASDLDQPMAVLPETQYEFKPVPDGTVVAHGIKIHNKGSAVLKIEKVRTG